MIKTSAEFHCPLLLEDEGKLIGRCALPLPMRRLIERQPVIVLHTSLNDRVTAIIEDYIQRPLSIYSDNFGRYKGWKLFAQSMQGSLDRIKSRLGGLRHRELSSMFLDALYQYQNGGPESVFSPWVIRLLNEYYDPMYDYQLEKGDRKIVFEGTQEQVVQKIKEITY